MPRHGGHDIGWRRFYGTTRCQFVADRFLGGRSGDENVVFGDVHNSWFCRKLCSCHDDRTVSKIERQRSEQAADMHGRDQPARLYCQHAVDTWLGCDVEMGLRWSGLSP